MTITNSDFVALTSAALQGALASCTSNQLKVLLEKCDNSEEKLLEKIGQTAVKIATATKVELEKLNDCA